MLGRVVEGIERSDAIIPTHPVLAAIILSYKSLLYSIIKLLRVLYLTLDLSQFNLEFGLEI